MLARTNRALGARLRLFAPLLVLLVACSDAPEGGTPRAASAPSQGLAPGPSVVQAAAPSTEARPAAPAEAPVVAREIPPMESRAPQRPEATPARQQDFRMDHVLDEQQVKLSSASVVTLLPEADAQNVSRGTNIEVTFSEPMDEGSITARTFHVRSGGTAIAGSVDYDADQRKAIFDPSAPLPANSVITVELAELASSDGGVLQPVEWTFTTGG